MVSVFYMALRANFLTLYANLGNGNWWKWSFKSRYYAAKNPCYYRAHLSKPLRLWMQLIN